MSRNPLVDPQPGDIVRVSPCTVNRFVLRRTEARVYYQFGGTTLGLGKAMFCGLKKWGRDLKAGVVIQEGQAGSGE